MKKLLLLVVAIVCSSASLHAQRPGLEIINPAPGRQPTALVSGSASGSSRATGLTPVDRTENWLYPYKASPEKRQKILAGPLKSYPKPPLNVWELFDKLGQPDVIESLSGPLKYDLGSTGNKDDYFVRCIWFVKKANYSGSFNDAWIAAYVDKNQKTVSVMRGWHLTEDHPNSYASVEGSGKPRQPLPVEDIPSPLRILYKPKATFTREGCQQDFAGAVTLEVQFLASGIIGRITIVKAAPYGLTEQAIAAAKQIRFEPMKYEGKMLTSRKEIKFDFDPTVSCSR